MSSRLLASCCCVLSALFAVDGVVAARSCWRPPADAPVSDPFREPACRWCPGNRGIEYATRPGDPVRAVAVGVVTFSGEVAGDAYVVVRHRDGRRTTYGGLVVREAAAGDVVVPGSIIGRSGSSLHFGVRDGDRYLDPEPFLGRLVHRARLVPVHGEIPRSRHGPVLRCPRADPPS